LVDGHDQRAARKVAEERGLGERARPIAGRADHEPFDLALAALRGGGEGPQGFDRGADKIAEYRAAWYDDARAVAEEAPPVQVAELAAPESSDPIPF
jgi:hypothetical protein